MTDNYKSFSVNISQIKGKRTDGKLMDFNDAERQVVEYIKEKRMEAQVRGIEKKTPTTKAELREEMDEVRTFVSNCILENNMSIRGYSGANIKNFIEEMVHEISGYSILSDAFEDDEITDIYCIEWNKIFVEKKGENVRYWKTFRDKKHYERTVERFISASGKVINNGENKIVDFELFQDRGCATCPIVSPKDYTITLRKHSEDHIILDQLLEWGVLSEEMSDFFGMAIDGESNIIYAGLTGSGKTTSIRALIDHYVTKNKRRMLVCEDTQELFPKNEHTVELVSVKNDSEKLAISISDLIITALRLKPKYIVVGEVRGKEALAAVEGMETGHATIFTMHGGTVINIVNRLVTKYLMAMPSLGIEVVERIVGASVDYVAIQDNIPGIGRKITTIEEVDYDFEKGRVVLRPIFKFDFEINDFKMISRISPDKAEKMMRRGVSIDRIRPWIKTNDEEFEAKYLAELNAKYLAEKPARLIAYKERQEERKAKKAEEANSSEKTTIKNESVIAVLKNERDKEEEINRLVNFKTKTDENDK